MWWPQGCCLERSFTKSEKKIGQIRSGATGTVPSALRSRGQCALESPRSMLRVARTCPQSAARTTGRAAIDRVVERMNGREAEACNRIFSNSEIEPGQCGSCTAGNSYSCKKKIQKRVFACGEAASQTEVPVRRSRAGTESDHNYANTTSFKGGSNFLLL